MIRLEYNSFGFCCGLGDRAKGFTKAVSRVGNMIGTWKCIGGFETLTGVPCMVMNLFTRQPYTAFDDAEPPAGWREATPNDIVRAAGHRHPHCVFISSPWKGASGLLSETLSSTRHRARTSPCAFVPASSRSRCRQRLLHVV